MEDDGKIFPFSNTGFIYAWIFKVWQLLFCRGCAPQSITCRGNPAFTLVWFSSNTALILPPAAYQGQSKISPLAVSERFTLRRRRGIGVLKPHPRVSVNGAFVVNKCFKFSNVVWYVANKGQILYCIKVQSKNGIAICALKKINVKIKNRIEPWP